MNKYSDPGNKPRTPPASQAYRDNLEKIQKSNKPFEPKERGYKVTVR